MAITSTNVSDCYKCKNSESCTKREGRLRLENATGKCWECCFYISEDFGDGYLSQHYYTGDLFYDY